MARIKFLAPRASGPDHYRWIADRAILKANGRPSAIRVWRERVLAVNPAGCLKCGSQHKLHVHHADSWAGNVARRLDPLNGAPLCAAHHREFHRLHGRDNVTQEQLHDYLGYPAIEREVIETEIAPPRDPQLAQAYHLIMAGKLVAARSIITREISRLQKVEEQP